MTQAPEEANGKAGFVGRFHETWSRLRSTEIRCGLCWTVTVAAAAIALLAAADYAAELSWSARAAGLAMAALLALVVAARGIVGPVLWWSRPRTAVEIERRFPQLGQRVRTVVQFEGRSEAALGQEGALPMLLAALQQDTDDRTAPLDLGLLVPRRKLMLAALAGAGSVAILLLAASANLELGRAIGRALLDDSPYTRLRVCPGDARLDQGSGLTVSVAVEGRVPQHVAVYCRPVRSEAGGEHGHEDVAMPPAEWEERELTEEDKVSGSSAGFHRTTRFESVQEPIEYCAVAGRIDSPVYHISVRLPVAIRKFKADLVPPQYTAIKPSTVPGGDLDVVEGTQVRFRVELDRPVAEARLVLSDPPGQHGHDDVAMPPLPMEIQGSSLAVQLSFRDEKCYRIAARAADGTSLAEKRYYVRLRKDQQPRVSFLEPDEALEVHPLAEVLAKIRVEDDFGLARAGIVFSVNGGEERRLILKDFKADPSKPSGGSQVNVTQATVEEMFRLEDFNPGQTDSITYYAFAEDNYPGGAHRTETDLRFIDIRPFKRIYKVGGT